MRKYDWNLLIGRAFDYAADRGDGFTVHELATHLEVPRGIADKVIMRVRRSLDGDVINLVCEPQGSRLPWRYRLVGNVDDARWWSSNRIVDTEQRIRTQHAVALSMVAASDGRTLAGRKVRTICKTLGRLIEDLDEIQEAAT